MKNKLYGIVVGSLLLLGINYANAGAFGLDNWYAAGSGGVTWHDDHKFGTSTREYDMGGGAALSFGYMMPAFCNGWSLRAEGEVVYRRNSLDKFKDINVDIKAKGHTSDLGFMVNLILDIPLQCGFGLYAGGGLGVSMSEVELSSIGGLSVAPTPTMSRDNLFAWQFLAGLSYDINPCIVLTTGYRLFMTDKVSNATGSLTSKDFSCSHSIDFGVIFKL